MVSVPKELNDIIEKIKKNEVLEENRHKEVTDILSETSRLREENARLSDLLLEKDMEKEELRVNLAVKKEETKFQEFEKKLVAEARLKWIKMNDDYEAQLDRESHERWEQRRSYIASLHADIAKIKSEEVNVEELERIKQLLAGTINKPQPAVEKCAEIEEEFIDFDMIEQLDSLESCREGSRYKLTTQKENEPQNSTPQQSSTQLKSKYQNIPRQINTQNSILKSRPLNPTTFNRRLNFESNEKSKFSQQPKVNTSFNPIIKPQFTSKQNSSFDDYNDDDFEFIDDFSPIEKQKTQYTQNSYSNHSQKSQFLPIKSQNTTQKSNTYTNSSQKSQFAPQMSQNYEENSLSYSNPPNKSQFEPIKSNMTQKLNSVPKSQFVPKKSQSTQNDNSYKNPSQKSQFEPIKSQIAQKSNTNPPQKLQFAPKTSQTLTQNKSNFEYNKYESSKEPIYESETTKSSQNKPRYEFISAKTHYNTQNLESNKYVTNNSNYQNQRGTPFDSNNKSQFIPKNPTQNNFAPIRKENITINSASATSLKNPVATYKSGFQFKIASTAASIRQPVSINRANNNSGMNTGSHWLQQSSFEDNEVEAASTNHQAAYERRSYDNFSHSPASPFYHTSPQETSSAEFTHKNQTPKQSKFIPKNKSQYNQHT